MKGGMFLKKREEDEGLGSGGMRGAEMAEVECMKSLVFENGLAFD